MLKYFSWYLCSQITAKITFTKNAAVEFTDEMEFSCLLGSSCFSSTWSCDQGSCSGKQVPIDSSLKTCLNCFTHIICTLSTQCSGGWSTYQNNLFICFIAQWSTHASIWRYLRAWGQNFFFLIVLNVNTWVDLICMFLCTHTHAYFSCVSACPLATYCNMQTWCRFALCYIGHWFRNVQVAKRYFNLTVSLKSTLLLYYIYMCVHIYIYVFSF